MQRPAKPFTPVRFRIQPPMVMNIGIIGYGFVGKALFNALNDDVTVLKVDPKLGTTVEQLKKFEPDCTFLCLPTPMHDDGSQDISIVMETLLKIKEIDITSLIVIKSTIHPGNIQRIQKIFPDFVYNPEFLREKYADDDFINSKLIVFGGKKSSRDKLGEIYEKYTRCRTKEYINTDPEAASLVKYAINSFLATKVIFFNELKSLLVSSNSTEKWENFIEIISKDNRIGSSHMNVPGHDGRNGFGGACLPKDSSAIIKYADSLKIDMTLIKTTISTNNHIRASYNSKTDRENEQNIIYKDKEE